MPGSPGGLVTLALQFFPSPSGGSAEQVAAALRAHGLVAAVWPALVSDPPMREAYLLADPQGRLLRSTVDGIEAGPEPEQVLEPLSEATGCTVGLEASDLVFCPPDWQPVDDAADDESRVGDVLSARRGDAGAGRIVEDWARRSGSALRYVESDGAVTARFEQPGAALHRISFGPGRHPVVVLSLIRGVRHLSVLTSGDTLPGFVLRPERSMVLSFDPELVGAQLPDDAEELTEFVQWARAPQGGPGLVLDELLAEDAFADCDRELARAALSAANDEQWSAGMLAALGLDPELADLHEGRAPWPVAAAEPPVGLLGRLFRRRG